MKRNVIAFDFDGTLHSNREGDPIGAPIQPVIDYLYESEQTGTQLILITMRPKSDRKEVKGFLARHHLNVSKIYFTYSDRIDILSRNKVCVYLDDRLSNLRPIQKALPLLSCWRVIHGHMKPFSVS